MFATLLFSNKIVHFKIKIMHYNWYVFFIAAVIPLLTGFVWYNPKTFANAWMKASGVTPGQPQRFSMPIIFGMTFLLGLLLSGAVLTIVVHQTHYYSILMDNKDMMNPNSDIAKATQAFMDVNGLNFRTFKHGAFHGSIAGLLFAMPVLGINALFESKGWNYIFIQTGYWMLTLALMGGVICQFA